MGAEKKEPGAGYLMEWFDAPYFRNQTLTLFILVRLVFEGHIYLRDSV